MSNANKEAAAARKRKAAAIAVLTKHGPAVIKALRDHHAASVDLGQIPWRDDDQRRTITRSLEELVFVLERAGV